MTKSHGYMPWSQGFPNLDCLQNIKSQTAGSDQAPKGTRSKKSMARDSRNGCEGENVIKRSGPLKIKFQSSLMKKGGHFDSFFISLLWLPRASVRVAEGLGSENSAR